MERAGNKTIWPVLFCWALTAALYVTKAILTAGATPLILDSDDAMRLTEVHDFLNGQSWYDLVQHRLNAPFGAEMHWSRLVDLPEAALLLLLRPVFGTMADTAAAYAWPLLLLLPLLWLTGRLATRFGGRAALWPALLLPGFSLITLVEFAPGRFDHHSAQILMTLTAFYCTIRSLDRPRFALGAGIAAAAAIAIGIEGLPMIVGLVAVFAVLWVAAPAHAVALRNFGLSFAISTSLALAIGVHPAHWLDLRIDAISIVYAAGAILVGIAFTLLPLASFRSWTARLALAGFFGAVAVAILLGFDPSILKGPYAALDPWLVKNWLAHISEAETWVQSFIEDPVYPVAVTLPVLLALAVTTRNAVLVKSDRSAWVIYTAMLVVGLGVMVIQIRAARIVTPLAVPATAVMIVTAWRWSKSRRGLLPAFAVVSSVIASAGLVVAALVALVPIDHPIGTAVAGDRQACLQPSAFADLAGLPPERIMAPIDLGAHLLLFTPHAVVGAPYHRNQQGLLDTLHFFNDPLDAARAILDARGIALVVICPAMTEIRGMIDHAPDSFVSRYADGRLPAWLVNQSLPGAVLQVYSVAPR